MARSPYAAVTHKRGSHWQWHRPNGERVPLHGFNEHQLRAISPALQAVDVHLRPEHRLNASVHVKKPRAVSIFSRITQGKRKGIVGGLAYSNQWGKAHPNAIHLHPKIFKSEAHPPGVFSHEVGHVLGPGQRLGSKHHPNMREFRDQFGYRKQFTFSRGRDTKKYRHTGDNIVRHAKTAQSRGADEDFAETFRASIGQSLLNHKASSRQRDFYRVAVTRGRHDYLKKHYLR